MNCKKCETQNPDEANYCMRCGTKLKSGGALDGACSKVKAAFDLSGGICLMTAVLLSLVFVFFIGITATVSAGGVTLSETDTILQYFGKKYNDLAVMFRYVDGGTAYYRAANYLPVALSTAIGATSIVCVVVFSILAAIRYAKHFVGSKKNYARPAAAAILSFVLGAAAFYAVNSSAYSLDPDLQIRISMSGVTLAGIILCGILLVLYLAFHTVTLGKELTERKTAINLTFAAAGMLFLVLTATLAAAPSVSLKDVERSLTADFKVNFSNTNLLISALFTGKSEMDGTFLATYFCSAFAQLAQLALLALAFVALIRRAGGYGKESGSGLGLAIALFSVAALYLVLTCTAVHFGCLLTDGYMYIDVTIAAAPAAALIASAFVLAGAITHKLLLKKAK